MAIRILDRVWSTSHGKKQRTLPNSHPPNSIKRLINLTGTDLAACLAHNGLVLQEVVEHG